MHSLLLATLLLGAGSAPAPHPVTNSVPQAHVPTAQLPTAGHPHGIPGAILVKTVMVGELTFNVPASWVQQGNRFSPGGATSGVSVTVSEPTAISADFRSWFSQRAGELQAGNSLMTSPTVETPKQGFTLEQTESHPLGQNTLFAAADLGNGQVQTITFEAPDQTTFTNWKPSVDVILTSLTR